MFHWRRGPASGARGPSPDDAAGGGSGGPGHETEALLGSCKKDEDDRASMNTGASASSSPIPPLGPPSSSSCGDDAAAPAGATAPHPPTVGTGLSRRTSSISSALGGGGMVGSSASTSTTSSSGLAVKKGGRGGGSLADGDEEEGIVVEVDSSGTGERPRSFRKDSKEDLQLLAAVAVATSASSSPAASEDPSSTGGGGGGSGSGGSGASSSSIMTPVDTYLRSFYSSAFLRRTTAKAAGQAQQDAPSSGSGGGGGGGGLSSVGGGDGRSASSLSLLGSSEKEKEKERDDRDHHHGRGGIATILSKAGQSSVGGGGGGGEMSALARAFEKRRLAVLASLRHRTKLSLVLFCPLIVLIMLLATLVSFSQGEGAAVPPSQVDDLARAFPATAALLGAGSGGGSGTTGAAKQNPAREKYTVMINTYKRHDMAKDAVRHYAGCDRVDAIRVVWSENTSAPQPGKDKEWFSEKKEVSYDEFPTTSLNNRFVPPTGLRTDAVFAVDDDIRVPCQDLDFAYEVWKVADDSLVGFMPRIHTLNPAALSAAASKSKKMKKQAQQQLRGDAAADDERIPQSPSSEAAGEVPLEHGSHGGGGGGGVLPSATVVTEDGRRLPLFRYNGWWKVWWDGEYSLVLTKAAFLHKDFLRAYTEEMPERIRDYVDANRNCEDIAMQFLASNLTGKPPIFVRGRVTDLGVFKGISTKSWTKLGHMKSRGQCLNDFVDLYGSMPLVKGSVVAGPASSWVFNRPSSIFEYVSSDMLVGGGSKAMPSVRRARLLHLIPLLALMILVIVKLMY